MSARRLLACLALLLGGTPTVATSAVDLSLEAMLERADRIVYGRVRDTTAARAEDGEPRTTVALDVERDLSRAGDRVEEITLSFLGGEADGASLEVEDVPRFEPGEHVLVLAYEDEENELASPIVGVWQGVWRLRPEGLADERGRLLTPSEGGLAPAGEGGDLTRTLEAIEAWILGEGELLPAPETGTGALPPPDASGPDEAPTEAATVEETEAADEASDATEREPEPEAEPEAEPEPESEVEGRPAPEGPDDGPPDGVGDEDPAGDREAPDEEPAEAPAATSPSGATDDEADAEGMDEGPQDAAGEPIEIRLRPPEDDALRSTVESAAAAWRAAGLELRVAWDGAAADVVRTGSSERFGPDALSLTLRRADEPGAEILVREDVAATATGVLAYELAGLVGAPRRDEGVLSGRFPGGGSAAPDRDDAAALAASRTGPRGDLDGDGDVDFYDLALLAEAYGRSGARLPADLDDSGRVDDADVEALREGYRFLPPSPEPPPGRPAAD